MQVTLLGTGSAMPTGQRFQAGYLVTTAEATVLVDCGAGILQRVAGTEPGYTGIDAILLTHHHLDHVADLLPLLKARWLADAGPISIYGPPGTEAMIADAVDTHDYLAGRLEYAATDIEPSSAVIDGIDVAIHETDHSMQCFAYRIPGPDGDLTLSGDTVASTELATFADGSAVLIHDCSFPDGTDTPNHPTPTDLGRVLEDVDVGRIILTHLYPDAARQVTELCEVVGRYTTCPVDVLPDETSIVVR